jgi:hypothetical protein
MIILDFGNQACDEQQPIPTPALSPRDPKDNPIQSNAQMP